MNKLSATIAKRNAQRVIENETGAIQVKNVKPNELLYIRACNNATITMAANQRMAKIIIENCSNTTISLPADTQLITQMVELLNLKNCTVFLGTDVQTMQCDALANCTLQFPEPVRKEMKLVWSQDCTAVNVQTVNVEQTVTQQHAVVLTPNTTTTTSNKNDEQDYVDKKTQYMSKFGKSSKEFATVQLVREGVGMLTTVEEKAKHDAILQKLEEKMEEMIKNDLENAFFKPQPQELPATVKVIKDEVKEYIDDDKVINNMAKLVANWIKNSKHCVIYTGAGVSTSSGIPDYRGPQGVWTLREQGLRPKKAVELGLAEPTYCHYAMSELVKKGFCKYITSTNLDGLHRRSGVPENKISELHGNIYRETCEKCKKEYLRGYDTTKTVLDAFKHHTGRHCECGGKLKDTIIHFTESLPEVELDLALKHGDASDLAIVLGTSMQVAPACHIPYRCSKNNGKLVIVNLQKTSYDDKATKIYAKTDEFMRLLMEELGLKDFDQDYDLLDVLPKEQVMPQKKATSKKNNDDSVVDNITDQLLSKKKKGSFFDS